MTQVLNLSDYHLILSDEHSRFITRSSSQTSPPACAPSASDRTDTARLADRDLQTLRAAQLPLCRRNCDPFAGARYPGESILRRHLRVRAIPSLQADWADRRDPHSVPPHATG